MPLRLASCLCAALLLIVLAAGGQSAVPASGHWQAVLAAGDRAEPVFDNAVAALSSWLASRGVPVARAVMSGRRLSFTARRRLEPFPVGPGSLLSLLRPERAAVNSRISR